MRYWLKLSRLLFFCRWNSLVRSRKMDGPPPMPRPAAAAPRARRDRLADALGLGDLGVHLLDLAGDRRVVPEVGQPPAGAHRAGALVDVAGESPRIEPGAQVRIVVQLGP